jgi:GT2 family glycosyltransferase
MSCDSGTGVPDSDKMLSKSKSVSPIMVSVVIVSWNARGYLVQCLNSLSSEVCRYPMEIVVVDNASSDGSAESVAHEFPHVHLIRNSSNLGFAKANNIGISSSSGQYVCLVNSDVKVKPDCITRLVEYCEQHPTVGIVGPRIIGADGKLQRSCRSFPNLWNMFCRALALDSLFPRSRWFSGFLLYHWSQDCLRHVDILTGCFWLVRRQALAQVGLLDERFFMYGEDMDWCKRFWLRGWQLTFIPSAEAIHYGGASSANAPVRFYIERHRADLQYWKMHHSRPAVFCFFLICCLHLMLRALGYSLAFVLKSRERVTCGKKAKRSVACLKWMLSDGIREWNWVSASGVAGVRGDGLGRNVSPR